MPNYYTQPVYDGTDTNTRNYILRSLRNFTPFAFFPESIDLDDPITEVQAALREARQPGIDRKRARLAEAEESLAKFQAASPDERRAIYEEQEVSMADDLQESARRAEEINARLAAVEADLSKWTPPIDAPMVFRIRGGMGRMLRDSFASSPKIPPQEDFETWVANCEDDLKSDILFSRAGLASAEASLNEDLMITRKVLASINEAFPKPE